MLLDILVTESNIALDLIDKTTRSSDVQRIVQISLAPAFLLAGIGALMNVMMARLIWIAGRIERLEDKSSAGLSTIEKVECTYLRRRRKLVQHAVKAGTASALLICVVIALLFGSAVTQAHIGTVIAIAWILAMTSLIVGLLLFLMETLEADRKSVV